MNKRRLVISIVILAVLLFAFWYGGSSPHLHGWELRQKASETFQSNTEKPPLPSNVKPMDKEADEATTPKDKPQNAKPASKEKIELEKATPGSTEASVSSENAQSETVINEAAEKDKYITDALPEGNPMPAEPQNTAISSQELTCTLSVRCDTILQNIAWLDSGKIDIIPKDGIIFPEKTVIFYEGESVFNLLLREMKKNKIHMEFENTPIYNNTYIEGIANLYEFDCGELSGWMYKVNGWFPNYGCSNYQLKAGDKVEWVYTCDLGIDVGGNNASSGNRRGE